ncbi:MAG: putative motility protein [Fibrobacterota bacterium]|jgi:hypothetical protein
MDTSAIEGSARGEGLQGAVQISILKKSQDLAAMQMQQMISTINAVSPTHLGKNIDEIA